MANHIRPGTKEVLNRLRTGFVFGASKAAVDYYEKAKRLKLGSVEATPDIHDVCERDLGSMADLARLGAKARAWDDAHKAAQASDTVLGVSVALGQEVVKLRRLLDGARRADTAGSMVAGSSYVLRLEALAEVIAIAEAAAKLLYNGGEGFYAVDAYLKGKGV